MAEDWIALRIHAQHPKVLRIASLVGEHPILVVGRMAEWFRHVDQHCAGRKTCLDRGAFHHIIQYTPRHKLVDPKSTPIEGQMDFFEALLRPEIGWLKVEDGLITIPEYERFFSKSSKRRILESRRKAAQRCGQNADTLRTGCAGLAPQERERETEREEDSFESKECALDSVSDSTDAWLESMRQTTKVRVAETMKIPADRYRDQTNIGKQVRADLTTIDKLVTYAIRAPVYEDARRQMERVLGVSKRAVKGPGTLKVMARLVHLAKEEGLWPG